MALDLTSLTRRDLLGHVGDGPGSVKYEYGYVTGDLPAVSDAANYFNGAAGFLQVGDIIRIVNGVPTTPSTKVYVVTVNTGTVVTVA